MRIRSTPVAWLARARVLWRGVVLLPLALGCALGCGPDAMDAQDGGGEDLPPELACDEPAALQGATPLPEAVDDVIARRCRACHSDPTDRFAPMPIVTWQDVLAPAPEDTNSPVYERIKTRINADLNFRMPPQREPQLTDDELAVLNDWLQDCPPAPSE